MMKRFLTLFFFAALFVAGGIAAKTFYDLQPVDHALRSVRSDARIIQVTDRSGLPLTISYQNRWNYFDHTPLHRIPVFLKDAFILSEDKRFYRHEGIDWRARFGAVYQNIFRGGSVRGASTITEQVVRMLHPRPRNLWSKWLEGWEAAALEKHYSKADIFEFYLNQLPYAANRRGVLQASRYYFDRDLSTLSPKEMLALAVLARAPSSYDLYRDAGKIDAAIARLATALNKEQKLSDDTYQEIKTHALALSPPEDPVNAAHFVSYLRKNTPAPLLSDHRALRTTLDASLQKTVQQILDERVAALSKKSLHNGAALIVDHRTGEILSWVVAGANNKKTPGRTIDAVTAPRQPGSALKPFLYTLALEKGWTPVTLIDDSPMSESIGSGLHRFKNYSNMFYGPIPLREALANSLNIPALRTISYVGTEKYLSTLHQLHFTSLQRGAAIYDEGLALGNGEVTLFELVQGYTALANRGVFHPLRFLMEKDAHESARVYSQEAASLIANILSDPYARRLEFGAGSVLNLPVQTAVKTGTSTDYRDAWAVGFNSRYAVGVWMGNLDQKPTDGITGSTGPALALRSIFSELNKSGGTAPLYLSPKLIRRTVCVATSGNEPCVPRTDYFIPGHLPEEKKITAAVKQPGIASPVNGLQIAYDPRIPKEKQKFEFKVEGFEPGDQVEWQLNEERLSSDKAHYLWPVARGEYQLVAAIVRDGDTIYKSGKIRFLVK